MEKKGSADTNLQSKEEKRSIGTSKVKQAVSSQKLNEERRSDQKGRSSAESDTTTWMGVRKLAWRKVVRRDQLQMKESGKLKKRLWLFGDKSLERGGKGDALSFKRLLQDNR